MGGIAAIVTPVFVMIMLGAAGRYWRLLEPGGLRGLNDLTFYLAIPALLFGSVVEAPDLRVIGAASLYFGVCVSVFAVSTVLALRVLGTGLAQSSVVGMNCCYGNTVMLGVPVVSSAYGAEGLATMLPIIALHSILLLPMVTFFIEADGQDTRNPLRILRAVLPSLVRNPIIIALLLAMVWRALGVPVPSPLHRWLAMIGAAAPTLALFGLGASLPDFAAKGSVRETGMAAVLKLVVFPALVWAGAHLAGLAPLPTAVAVVTAGCPTGANAFFLARRTGTMASASAGTVVLTTALSIVTLSVILSLLHG